VVEHGVNKAAARLHRVPSNVTTRIKQLEEQLGAKLSCGSAAARPVCEGKLLLTYGHQLLRLSSRPKPRYAMESRGERCASGRWKVPRRAGCRRCCPATTRLSEVLIELVRALRAPGFARAQQDVEAAFVAEPFNAEDLETRWCSWKSWFSSRRRASAGSFSEDLENRTVIAFTTVARIGDDSKPGWVRAGSCQTASLNFILSRNHCVCGADQASRLCRGRPRV